MSLAGFAVHDFAASRSPESFGHSFIGFLLGHVFMR